MVGQPEWHPSGDYIVFQAVDPALRGLEITGKLVQGILTSPGAGLQNNLWLGRTDGSAAWQLTHIPDRGGILHPHFSPDGKTLVWSEHLPKAPGRMENHWVIRMANLNLSPTPRLENIRTIRPDNAIFYEAHSFSPEGSKLLFCAASDKENLFTLDLFVLDFTNHEASTFDTEQ
ncbi:MAG: hypothetical protein HC898_04620 [Phycisphaerales bacterium]|nr:hypothetical protein [Phycisphaerales bacterium]